MATEAHNANQPAKSIKTVAKPKKTVTAKPKVTKTNGSAKAIAAETIRTNINIEKALHVRAQKFATKNDLSFTKLINNAIKSYIKTPPKMT